MTGKTLHRPARAGVHRRSRTPATGSAEGSEATITRAPGAANDADPAGADARPITTAPPSAQMSAHGHGLPANVAALPSADRRERLRILEAVLFAAAEPVAEASLAAHLPPGADVAALMAELQGFYAGRGVNLVRVAGKWAFRTATDLGYLMRRQVLEERRLSRAALETLAIIAYHQPVTRAEIEEIRGVSTSKGSLDVLMEQGWVRLRGRRRAPGRPVTYGTTDAFLVHFGLDSIKDLPGLADLKGAGLLDGNLPAGFAVPEPRELAALLPDELPLETGDDDDQDEGAADDPAELPFDDVPRS